MSNRIHLQCPMSGRQTDRFGGGTDQCDCCGNLVYIAQTGRVAKHRAAFTTDGYNEAFRRAERSPRLPSRRRHSAVRHHSVWC